MIQYVLSNVNFFGKKLSLLHVSRILLFFSLMLISVLAQAGFFSDVATCLSDHCSCANSSVHEQWGPDGQDLKALSGPYRYAPTSDKFSVYDFDFITSPNYIPGRTWPDRNDINYPDKNCAPFNKYGGRKNCLYQFDSPQKTFNYFSWPPLEYWPPQYRVYCAEADPDTSFESPQIKLRLQMCNLWACWTESFSMDAASAQCTIRPTQYAIPTVRFCARVANKRLKVDEKKNVTYIADHGYQDHFLDTNGFPRPDFGITNKDGYTVFVPKICLYEDPSIVEGFWAYMESYRDSTMDWFDTSIYRQPLHKGQSSGSKNFFGMFAGVTANDVVDDVFYYTQRRSYYTPTLYDLVEKKDGLVFDPKTQFKQWVSNFAVNKQNSLGCVSLPIGPYPVAFCDKLRALPPEPSIQRICPKTIVSKSTDAGYVLEYDSVESTYTVPCVNSDNVYNDFINNAVRVVLNNYVNLCQEGVDPYSNEAFCITPNLGGVSLSAIHTLYNDKLPICQRDDDEQIITPPPCIKTSVQPNSLDNGQYRLVYGVQKSASSYMEQIYAYPTDISFVCGSGDGYPCVGIFGVDVGSYRDIAVSFDGKILKNDPNAMFLKGDTVSLQDQVLDSDFDIFPYVSYQGLNKDNISIQDGANRISLPPNAMCLFFQEPLSDRVKKIGCVNRAPMPLVSSFCPYIADNFHPNITARLSYKGVQNAPTHQMILNVPASNLSLEQTFNLLGVTVDTVVIDTNNPYEPPFPESRRVFNNPLFMIGDYKDNITPINQDGSENINAKYIGGNEYINGVYVRGGKKIIVRNRDDIKCHTPIDGKLDNTGNLVYDNRNCVLAKRNYADIIDCSSLVDLSKLKECDGGRACPDSAGMRMIMRCGANSTNQCYVVKTLQPNNPAGSTYGPVYIKLCTGGGLCYQADGYNDDVCQVSTKKQDRIIPADTTNDLLNVAQFYDYIDVSDNYCKNTTITSDSSGSSRGDQSEFNNTKCGVRDKTLIEKNPGCDIPPPPNCVVSSEANKSTGNASWTGPVKVGEYSVGTCKEGFKTPSAPLKRLCYLDNQNNNKLEEITTSIKCTKDCDAITQGDASTGYATWTFAKPNAYSTGTCSPGYLTPDGGLKRRLCTETVDNVILEPIDEKSTCTDLCKPRISGIYSAEQGFADWTSQGFGNPYIATCTDDLVMPIGGFSNRRCTVQANDCNKYSADATKYSKCIKDLVSAGKSPFGVENVALGEWCFRKELFLVGRNGTTEEGVLMSSSHQDGNLITTSLVNGAYMDIDGRRVYGQIWSIFVGHPSYHSTGVPNNSGPGRLYKISDGRDWRSKLGDNKRVSIKFTNSTLKPFYVYTQIDNWGKRRFDAAGEAWWDFTFNGNYRIERRTASTQEGKWAVSPATIEIGYSQSDPRDGNNGFFAEFDIFIPD